MPRNTLRRAGAAGRPPSEVASDAPFALPEDLRRLLDERRGLEACMADAAGKGAGEAPSGDPRFPVTSLGRRREADAAWADGRDRPPARSAPPPVPAPGGHAGSTPREPSPALRTGQRTVLPPPLRALPDGTAPPPMRALGGALTRPVDRPATRALADRLSLADRVSLPDRTSLRSLAEPALRPLGRGSKATRDRLDVLTGGSGDLDRLRDSSAWIDRMRVEDGIGARDDRRDRERDAGRATPVARDARRDADRDDRRLSRRRDDRS